MAEDKGIVLRVEIPAGAMVQGDRDLLFEAVTNLVDNAVNSRQKADAWNSHWSTRKATLSSG